MRSANKYSSESLTEAINFQIANAERYVRMGKEKEALEHLHDFIKQRRNHQYEKKSFEKLMLYYMNLCVKRQEHRLAKDGLYQLRALCQNTDPKSLETVVVALLRMAEAKAEEARQRADDRALTEAAKIPDLEDDEIFDQNLLDAYEEGLKSQTDKEIVVPWRKFRWETYRTVMDLLAKNPKFQELYHATCKEAFAFCKEYQRHREFRHLSEMLTKHLQELEKQQTVTKQKVVFEWTADTIRLHLDTRCAQLRVATELDLWNEAYKIVGDIDKILSKEACSPELIQEKLAEYELLLSRLFWASEDYLFHASALYMHFTLTKEQLQAKRDAETAAKLRSLASSVLLAALSIPRLDSADPKKSSEGTEALEYAARLLRFNVKPTRKALLADLVSKDLLNEVYPELQQLHNALEERFDPLGMVQAALPALQFIQQSDLPNLKIYAPLLEKVIVLRLVAQLSTVYSELRVDFIKSLLQPLSVSFCEVEKLLINAVADGVLNLRMDHRNRCIKFIAGTAAVHTMHGQLHRVATKLQRVAYQIQTQVQPEEVEVDRRRFLETVFQAAEEEHRLLTERMELIEKRSDTLRRQEERRREEDKAAKDAEERRRKEEENRRLEKEKEERDRLRVEQAQKAAQAKKVQDMFGRLGRQIDTEEAKKLVEEGRHKEELQEQQKKQAKAEDQRKKKLAAQHQKLDYLTRAIRMEEAPILTQNYERQAQEDMQLYQTRQEELQQSRREQHTKDLALKQHFQKMQQYRGAFERVLVETQKPAFLERLQQHRLANIERARDKKVKEQENRMVQEAQRRQQAADAQRRQEEREREAAARREEETRVAAETAASEETWRRAGEPEAPRSNFVETPADEGADEMWQRAGRRPAPAGEREAPWRRSTPDDAPASAPRRTLDQAFGNGPRRGVDEDRRGPPRGYEDNDRRGPPRGYEDSERRGPPRGFEDNDRRGPPRGFDNSDRRGPPRGYEDSERRGGRFEDNRPRGGFEDSERRGPPRGFDGPSRRGPEEDGNRPWKPKSGSSHPSESGNSWR